MIRRPRVEGCRPQGGAIACNDWYRHNLSMNMETRRQQSCIQFTLRTNALIQDVNSAFRQISPVGVKLLLSCYTRSQHRKYKSRLHRHPPSSSIRIVLLDTKRGILNVSHSSLQQLQRGQVPACMHTAAPIPGSAAGLLIIWAQMDISLQ